MALGHKKRGVRYDRVHQERTRQKIADAGVIDRLIRAYKGEIELSQGQITIGLKLIDKLVPNLQSVEQEITTETPFAVLPSPAPSADQWHKAFSPKGIAPAPIATKPSVPVHNKPSNSDTTDTKH